MSKEHNKENKEKTKEGGGGGGRLKRKKLGINPLEAQMGGGVDEMS